jgi:hypothetical protein
MNTSLEDSIEITKACVERDIYDANIFHALMFRWVNGLVAINGYERNFQGMFHYIGNALETKYIFALAKLFANSNEAGLWKFIQQARDSSNEAIEIRLESVNELLRDRFITQRQEFLSNFDQYEKRIREISEVINPYRNIQRAHNFPWRGNDKETTWNNTKEWLTFAESVFVQAVDSICHSCQRVGDFSPAELNGQMDFFVSLFKSSLEAAEAERISHIKSPTVSSN